MKNKLHTITAAALNLGAVTVDITFTIADTTTTVSFPRTFTYAPKDFQFTNTSGVALRYIFLNEQEFAEYSANPALLYYAKIPVAAAATVSGHVDGPYRLVIEKVSGVAIADVDFYGLRYIKSQI